jgi:hypothetical protein
LTTGASAASTTAASTTAASTTAAAAVRLQRSGRVWIVRVAVCRLASRLRVPACDQLVILDSVGEVCDVVTETGSAALFATVDDSDLFIGRSTGPPSTTV